MNHNRGRYVPFYRMAALFGGMALAAAFAPPLRAFTPKPVWETRGRNVEAFSPDGRMLAVIGTHEVPLSEGGQVSYQDSLDLLDARTGEPLLTLPYIDGAEIVFTRDSQYLVEMSWAYGAVVRRVSDGTQVSSFNAGIGGYSHTYQVNLLPEHGCVLSSGDKGLMPDIVQARSLPDGQLLWSVEIPGTDYHYHPYEGADVHYLPDGERFVAVNPVTAQIRRISDGALLREFTPDEWLKVKDQFLPPLPPGVRGSPIHSFPDGPILVTMEYGQTEATRNIARMSFWRADTGEYLDTPVTEAGEAVLPTFSSDFRFMAYSYRGQETGPGPAHIAMALNPYATANRGDVDLNGQVDVSDAVRTLRFLVDLDTPTTDERFRADVNGDDALTIGDVVLTLSEALQTPG